jgi:carboxyl-terminal processing protease
MDLSFTFINVNNICNEVKLKRLINSVFVLLIFTFGINLNAQDTKDEVLAKLLKVFRNVYENYVDSVDSYKLEEAAISGMLKELDPHSKYYPVKKMSDVSDGLKGEFEGIGIETATISDTVTVITVMQNTPADSAGLRTGDKLIEIDGKTAIGISGDLLSDKLKGPVGSPVKLKVKRLKSNGLLSMDMKRNNIPIFSVNAAFIIDGTDIGYIQFRSFTSKAHSEVVDSIKMLRKKGMKRLIIDIHGNSGGYLNQAFDIADEFIQSNQLVVYTKGRNALLNKEYFSTEIGAFESLPLIMLADKYSASASEILIGAIQDLDRGLVIGETTYGKGLVQRQYKNDDGSGYRITTSRYYTPSGRCIQRPFEDKTKYEEFVGRYDLEDGSKLEDLLKKLKKDFPEDSLPPVYKTKLGRTVIGGGGITPDYYVKYDKNTKLLDDLRRKKLLFTFTHNYFKANEENIRSKYQNNFKDYLRNFNFNDEQLGELKKIAEKNDIYWDPDDYKKDIEGIRTEMKAELSRNMWNTNEYVTITASASKQVEKAIELFPEAEKLAELK